MDWRDKGWCLEGGMEWKEKINQRFEAIKGLKITIMYLKKQIGRLPRHEILKTRESNLLRHA